MKEVKGINVLFSIYLSINDIGLYDFKEETDQKVKGNLVIKGN